MEAARQGRDEMQWPPISSKGPMRVISRRGWRDDIVATEKPIAAVDGGGCFRPAPGKAGLRPRRARPEL
eukprot:5918379-Pyramimonas_sp.AAC.1